jgi:hypothetical protein
MFHKLLLLLTLDGVEVVVDEIISFHSLVDDLLFRVAES